MQDQQLRTIKAHGRSNGPRACGRLEEVLEQLRTLHNACLHQYLLAEASHQPERFTRYSQQKELTQLRAHDPEFTQVMRRLQEHVIHNVSESWRKYAEGTAGKPRYKTGRYRTIGLDSPQGKVVKLTPAGNHVLKIFTLPTIRLLTTQEIPNDQQPVAVRITVKGRRIAARLSYRRAIPVKSDLKLASKALVLQRRIANYVV